MSKSGSSSSAPAALASELEVDQLVEQYVPLGVQLPSAEHASVPIATPILSANARDIYRDEHYLQRWWDESNPTATQLYPRVSGELMALRALWLGANPGLDFPGFIALALDQDAPLALLRSLVLSAALGGFSDPLLYVRTRNAPKHIRVLHINALPPALSQDQSWETARYLTIYIRSNGVPEYAWYEGARVLQPPTRVELSHLAESLVGSYKRFARYQKASAGINWAIVDAARDCPMSRIVPVLDSLEVPRRPYTIERGSVVEASAFEVHLALDEADIELLKSNWKEARAEASVVAETLQAKWRAARAAPTGNDEHSDDTDDEMD